MRDSQPKWVKEWLQAYSDQCRVPSQTEQSYPLTEYLVLFLVIGVIAWVLSLFLV